MEETRAANLINFAVLPLMLVGPADYDAIAAGDELTIENVPAALASADTVEVTNVTKDRPFTCRLDLSGRQRKILLAGGLLNYTRQTA